jgi:hypothetical protein
MTLKQMEYIIQNYVPPVKQQRLSIWKHIVKSIKGSVPMSTDVKVEPVKKVYLSNAIVRSSIAQSINFVLNSPQLNPKHFGYIHRMLLKHNAGKNLTTNEVAGLSAIEAGIKRDAKTAS